MQHRLANDIVKHTFETAELPSTLEPSGLYFKRKTTCSSPLIPYSSGKASVCDFTFVYRLAASYTELSIQVDATVAEQAESERLWTNQALERNYNVQLLHLNHSGALARFV